MAGPGEAVVVRLPGGAGRLWSYDLDGTGEQLISLTRLTGGSWPCGSSAHGPTRLESWRPGTGATMPVPEAQGGVAVGPDAVWVADPARGRLLRVDPGF